MKDEERTTYPMDAQLRMLLDLFTVGEQRVFSLESLASDPVFVKLAGGAIPGLDAVYRDLDRFQSEHVEKLHSLLVDHGLAPVRGLFGSAEVHLDIDSTVEVVFGQQQGATVGYNPRYRGRASYHPLVARCAETRSWVGAQFRPGNTSFGENDAEFVGSCIDSMRSAVGPNTVVYVRIDCAGDCAKIMKAIHKKGAYFVTKAKMSLDLGSAVLRHTDWLTVESDADGNPTRQVAEIVFRRDSWETADELPVRVIAVRTLGGRVTNQLDLWEDNDWATQVFLTNDMYQYADALAAKYNGRAGIEPMIAEAKNSWAAEAMSSNDYQANAAMLMLKLLAHNLLRRYVEEKVPAVRTWRTEWVRRVVVRVPGKLVCSGRQYTVQMPTVPALANMLC
jgi:hypothetical protein